MSIFDGKIIDKKMHIMRQKLSMKIIRTCISTPIRLMKV